MNQPLLRVDHVTRHYKLPRERLWQKPRIVEALNDVSLSVQHGHSLGIVGESGCGKSTLARAIMAFEPLDKGSIHIMGQNLSSLSRGELRHFRRHFQMVFQDPFGSLDPRMTINRILSEPLHVLSGNLANRREAIQQVLLDVGLRPTDMDKFPHEFSGGQRQRIALARALITRPDLIVADEPVSALDVSIQAQILNLMRDLQAAYGMTYVLISHDLSVVDYMCDYIVVMYLGRIVEQGPTQDILTNAAHPYTRLLLEAVPRFEAGRRRIVSLDPAAQPMRTLKGCAFVGRCPHATAHCSVERPELGSFMSSNHEVACHFPQI